MLTHSAFSCSPRARLLEFSNEMIPNLFSISCNFFPFSLNLCFCARPFSLTMGKEKLSRVMSFDDCISLEIASEIVPCLNRVAQKRLWRYFSIISLSLPLSLVFLHFFFLLLYYFHDEHHLVSKLLNLHAIPYLLFALPSFVRAAVIPLVF